MQGDKLKKQYPDAEERKRHAVAICHTSVMGSSKTVALMETEPIRAVPDQPGRYKCYAMRFRSAEELDLYGTYFDARTNYCLDYYNEWPWLYHHGTHSKVGSEKVGVWDKRGVDDHGIFVEGELLQAAAYHGAIETLIGEGVLYPSSQALSSMVEVGPDGHVLMWPIAEVTSTVMPADYLAQPLSPAARSAMLELGENFDERSKQMSDNKLWNKFRTFVDSLADDEGDTETGDTEGGGETETEDTRSTDDSDTGLDVEEVVRTITEQLGLDKVVEAIQLLDTSARSLSERLAGLEGIVQGLAKTEVEKIRSMAAGDEWYNKLFVASRSGEEDDTPGDGDDDDGDASGGLEEGETVWSRVSGQSGGGN